MENILRVIVDTDKASRLDVRKAEERRENLTAELAERKKEIDEKHKENVENAIAKTRTNTEVKVKREAFEIEARANEKGARLRKIYEENHIKWTGQIVQAVIGR